jgi:hypothetical protein
MERYRGVDFHKTRFSLFGGVNTSRRIGFRGGFNTGDQIRFVDRPFLGSQAEWNFQIDLRPFSRLQSEIGLESSRFLDVRSDNEEFDVKILRSLTTYQFTDRLLVRNIMEFNSYDNTLGANLLLTYRVNAGTVFFVGYDDRYQQGDHIDPAIFPTDIYQRTNRAVFTKLQYLFRY